ncbi:DNA replication helicase Dna2 [Striga asiatica]|uniref:DNA replication helicase Dna2 n=1 Tax=Striga asiatica TaxID=4170 RepID=A0A5A7R9E3_STRAF|nr:DNA replication helicase Dna2 [Striga asiatica]
MAESCFLDQSFDDLNVDVDFSSIDTSLVMSLLEDSAQVEYGDGEMLRITVKSLGQEIANHGSCLEMYKSDEYYNEDYQIFNVEQPESCSSTFDHNLDDFDWIGAEMDYSSTGYFIANFADKMENMIEFVALEDYSHFCYEIPMEEDGYATSLWQ